MHNTLPPSRCFRPWLAASLASTLLAILPCLPMNAQERPLLPQGSGLPYTRSAHAVARERLKNHIVLFSGSRYALVYGCKVRLDDAQLTEGEALLKEGAFLVPPAFSGVIGLKTFQPDPAPPYLVDRWIYTFARPQPVDVPSILHCGKPAVDALALAKSLGLKTSLHPRGLLLIGESGFAFPAEGSPELDALIAEFDTPEKFADPEIPRRWLQSLKEAGTWRDRAAPGTVKLYEGPETDWPLTPKEAYDFSGFNAAGLGAKVPPPGVHPRVFFSPEDLPGLRERMKKSIHGQIVLHDYRMGLERNLWKPGSPENIIFERLAEGNLTGLTWAPPVKAASNFGGSDLTGIWNTGHKIVLEEGGKKIVGDFHGVLTAAAFYCLLTDDEAKGSRVASAICGYFKLREPLLDQYNAISDSEFASTNDGANNGATHFRQMHGFGPGNAGVLYDLSACWMKDEQKTAARRYVAKTVYGRRGYGANGAQRWADVNWISWDTFNLHSAVAIEGEEGYDPEIYDNVRKIVRSWLDFGIDAAGAIHETNGKNVNGLTTILETLVVLARRGDNFLGHPHLRRLTQYQTQCLTPDATVNVNNGTWGDAGFSAVNAGFFRYFFPEDACANRLLWIASPEQALFQDPVQYEALAKKGGVPRSGNYFGRIGCGVVFDSDWEMPQKNSGEFMEPWERAYLHLPLTYNDAPRGLFITRSGEDRDATFMMFEARQDKWLGAGHYRADAGSFRFVGLGVNWAGFQMGTESRPSFKPLVTIDGESVHNSVPNVVYLGGTDNGLAAFAAADTKYAYDWGWLSQLIHWSDVDANQEYHRGIFEPEPDPACVKAFSGGERYKMRFWWHTYLATNWTPTFRFSWNPVRYAFRTVGLVRGAHPYGIVTDDIAKDEKQRTYSWNLPLGGGPSQGYWHQVVEAPLPGLAAGDIVLGREIQADPKTKQPAHLECSQGAPRLLVRVLSTGVSGPAHPAVGRLAPEGERSTAMKLSVPVTADHAAYRILLIPFRLGEPLPTTKVDGDHVDIRWADQADSWTFTVGEDHRTHCSVKRGKPSSSPVGAN